MYKERMISWSCGIIAFIVIVILGKSCMAVPESSSKKDNNTSDSVEYTESTNNNDGFGIVYPTISPEEQKDEIVLDMFGRPVKVTEPPEEEIEMPTDENGNPIEPPTEIYTDEDGNIIEPPTTENAEETQSENDSEDDEESAENTEISDEETDDEQSEENEEDEDEIPIPPGFSGYDHKKYDEEGQEKATLPPDFVIVIE
ncbi:MAG: hypothetical protein IKK66_00735 [Ruminococcus sp.]|nr:hypothetical protein [Ruminococcus sp.]